MSRGNDDVVYRKPNGYAENTLNFLVVDDSSMTRKLVAKQLAGKEFSINDFTKGLTVIANDAIDAASKFNTNYFDVVITDRNMGGGDKDGEALISSLRRGGYTGVIISMSGDEPGVASGMEVKNPMIDAGADYFFKKPLDAGQLKNSIQECLAARARGDAVPMPVQNKPICEDASGNDAPSGATVIEGQVGVAESKMGEGLVARAVSPKSSKIFFSSIEQLRDITENDKARNSDSPTPPEKYSEMGVVGGIERVKTPEYNDLGAVAMGMKGVGSAFPQDKPAVVRVDLKCQKDFHSDKHQRESHSAARRFARHVSSRPPFVTGLESRRDALRAHYSSPNETHIKRSHAGEVSARKNITSLSPIGRR